MNKKDTWAEIQKHINIFGYLYSRWLDEEDYEDIHKYLEAMKQKIPSVYKIEKRPFAIYFNTDNGDLKIVLSEQGKDILIACETPLI